MRNEGKATLAIRFFEEALTHTEGEWARKPFLLAPWQHRIISDVFGTVKSNQLRQYTMAYVEVPKKNGKTALSAGIALFGLLLDKEPGAQIYIAASTRGQAGIAFRAASQMVRNSPDLRRLCRIVDSTKTIYLLNEPNSFLKAISGDAGVEDGMNPHMVVFDELHRQKNSDLWDVLTYGTAARRQPLMFAITTAGISGHSPICEEMHNRARQVRDGIIQDPSFYPVLYGLDDEEDWTLEGAPAVNGIPATGWYKANPSLGLFLSVEKVREEFARAMSNPSQQNGFRRLRLDQWVGQETRYLPMEDWRGCGEPFDAGELVGLPCFGGLDLSATQDVTALALIFEREGIYYWLPQFWIPAHDLAMRSKRDRVPYDLWVSQGLVHATEGNQVDYGFVRKNIADLAKLYDIREIGYDRWNATQIIQDLTADGLTMIPIGQGYASMSAPTKELLRLVMGRKVRHGGNPVLTWMADCMAVKQDPSDSVKPSKPDRRKAPARIDGIVAGVNALARMIVAPEYQASLWDTQGFSFIHAGN